MKLHRFLVILCICATLLGCFKGVVLMDPYWHAILRQNDENPVLVAKKLGLSYRVVQAETEEELSKKVQKAVSKTRSGQWIIVSPWFRSFVAGLDPQRNKIGILGRQGLAQHIENAVGFEVRVSRENVLKQVLAPMVDHSGYVLLLYNKEEDFNVVSSYFASDSRLHAVFIENKENVECIADQVQSLLLMRDVQAVFILAEPHNTALKKVLRQELKDKTVYSTGIPSSEGDDFVFDDNFAGQLHSLMVAQASPVVVPAILN